MNTGNDVGAAALPITLRAAGLARRQGSTSGGGHLFTGRNTDATPASAAPVIRVAILFPNATQAYDRKKPHALRQAL